MAHVSNLKPWHRPPTPSLDRGPIQRRARRAFVGSGKQVLSTSEIMRWTHPRPRPVGGLSPTRELLTRDLQRRAYFGVSAALSLGTDNYELLDMRRETIPGAARFFSAGRALRKVPATVACARARVRALWGLSGWRGNEGIVSMASRRCAQRYCLRPTLGASQLSKSRSNSAPSSAMAARCLVIALARRRA